MQPHKDRKNETGDELKINIEAEIEALLNRKMSW